MINVNDIKNKSREFFTKEVDNEFLDCFEDYVDKKLVKGYGSAEINYKDYLNILEIYGHNKKVRIKKYKSTFKFITNIIRSINLHSEASAPFSVEKCIIKCGDMINNDMINLICALNKYAEAGYKIGTYVMFNAIHIHK